MQSAEGAGPLLYADNTRPLQLAISSISSGSSESNLSISLSDTKQQKMVVLLRGMCSTQSLNKSSRRTQMLLDVFEDVHVRLVDHIVDQTPSAKAADASRCLGYRLCPLKPAARRHLQGQGEGERIS